MIKIHKVAILTILSLFSLLPAPETARAGQLSVNQIMEKVYALGKYEKAHEKVTMELIRENGEKRVRVYRAKSLRKGKTDDRKRMFVFDTPTDIAGTAIFIDESRENGDGVWVYLPALSKKRRLPRGGKSESFVGSDFSYGDIIAPRLEEFKHVLRSEGPCPNSPKDICYVLEHQAASPAIVEERGVSFYKDWVRKDNFVPVRVEVKDAAGRPWKVGEASDIKLVDTVHGLWQPMTVSVENVMTHHRTRLIWNDLDLAKPVPAAKMNSDQLERGLE